MEAFAKFILYSLHGSKLSPCLLQTPQLGVDSWKPSNSIVMDVTRDCLHTHFCWNEHIHTHFTFFTNCQC